MLTQKDLDEIEKIVDDKLGENLKLLPSKDEFFEEMDKVMKELETIRDEQTIIGHQVSNHENRITSLEKVQLTSSSL